MRLLSYLGCLILQTLKKKALSTPDHDALPLLLLINKDVQFVKTLGDPTGYGQAIHEQTVVLYGIFAAIYFNSPKQNTYILTPSIKIRRHDCGVASDDDNHHLSLSFQLLFSQNIFFKVDLGINWRIS